MESVAIWGRDSLSVWYKDELHEWPKWVEKMSKFQPPAAVMEIPRNTRDARKRSAELDLKLKTGNKRFREESAASGRARGSRVSAGSNEPLEEDMLSDQGD